MRVSVITVCFNSAGTIADTLRSVAEQSYADIEHIVVDGSSTDGTLDIVGKTPNRVARIVSEPDHGIYDAMNKGIAMATGDIVGFLNSDDCYADSCTVGRIAQAMQSDHVDACYGDLVFVDPGNTSRVLRYWKAGSYIRGACARGWMPPHPTFYARRQVYERHGGFDLSFPIAADFEMSLRLLDVAGLIAVHIPEVLVRMRAGGASNRGLASVIRNNRETSRACHKYGLPGGANFLIKRLFSKLPELYRRHDL